MIHFRFFHRTMPTTRMIAAIITGINELIPLPLLPVRSDVALLLLLPGPPLIPPGPPLIPPGPPLMDMPDCPEVDLELLLDVVPAAPELEERSSVLVRL